MGSPYLSLLCLARQHQAVSISHGLQPAFVWCSNYVVCYSSLLQQFFARLSSLFLAVGTLLYSGYFLISVVICHNFPGPKILILQPGCALSWFWLHFSHSYKLHNIEIHPAICFDYPMLFLFIHMHIQEAFRK